MENSLRELFFSKDPEDIHLACIIARKTNIDPKEVDQIDTLRRQNDGQYYRGLVEIMHQYLELTKLNDEHNWQYYKWKEENDEPTDKGTTTK